MDLLQMLTELSHGWDVQLTSREIDATSTEWTLVITGFNKAIGIRSFVYRGNDLRKVVAQAWAGEPPAERR